jgi:NUMOD4 motif
MKINPKAGERWETIKGARGAQGQRYAISNQGRISSFLTKPTEGKLLRTGTTSGYPSISFRQNGERRTHLVHRLVAEYFCKRPSAKHKFVIHHDHKKGNNVSKNLKWTTLEEQSAHAEKDPNVIRSKRERGKLSPDQVKKIKLELKNPKKTTTLKSLAKKFDVSDMQIHRIKIGENWAHIKV